MKHVVCREFGPPDRLVVEEAPDPLARPGEVVVAVRAAGVTFVDALLVQGHYQIKPPLPFTPGGEVAGVIVAVGEGVNQSRLQERVLVSCGIGGFADRLAVPTAMARRLPVTLTFGQGAALMQSYSTALFALTRRAAVERGDWVLVLGAGGGVGLATVDVARHLGARVIAAASSESKLAAARAVGAQACIRYDQEDLKARAREISGGGVHMVVDPVGGAYAEPALRALRPFGHYLIVGFATGEIPALKANLVLLQNRSVVGVDWGAWSFQHPQENAALVGEVLALAACGTIQPGEPTSYPLDRAGDALQALVDRKVAGKVVLVP
ncbi:MAG TPA: NADPH:quinone oxidoreductase family protein [Candidatus Dormibacteraeota bacterium]|nr:NADPH:quinone oxidoreductase family protein [Candidatus Dormibacteraeota bacterium]